MLIKDDTGWVMDLTKSRPIKGYYNYKRTMVFDKPLSQSDLELVRATLKSKGQSPVGVISSNGPEYVFICEEDSGD